MKLMTEKRVVEIERNPSGNFIAKYGWEWYQVNAYPARLMKLMAEGILEIEIAYKSRRYTHYKPRIDKRLRGAVNARDDKVRELE